jgi:RNA polymerase sigma-70 factor (ECF subfamily)
VNRWTNIASAYAAERDGLVRYARVVSGDASSAEDLVQEALLRCEHAAETREIEEPAHLLWRVLRNLCIDRRRELQRHDATFVASNDDEQILARPSAQQSIEELLAAREELRRIQTVLDSVDPRARAAFEMHRLEGAKLREIGERLGISTTVAHGLVASVVAKLREAVRPQQC